MAKLIIQLDNIPDDIYRQMIAVVATSKLDQRMVLAPPDKITINFDKHMSEGGPIIKGHLTIMLCGALSFYSIQSLQIVGINS